MAKLFFHPISVTSWSPLLLLKENSIPHEVNSIEFGKHVDLILPYNPMHAIPTFVDADGTSVWESNAVCKYLVRKYKLNKYIPTDDEGIRLNDIAMDWRQTTFYKHVSDLAYPVLFGYPAVADPEKAKNLVLRDFEILTTYFLKDRPFIGGASPALADFVIAPVFKFVPCTGIEIPKDCQDYVARFAAAVPAYNELSANIDPMLPKK